MQDIILGYERTGNPDGLPLCLIHGWGCDSSFLRPVAAMFPQRDVLLIDLPGYGKSLHLEQALWSYQDCVQALCRTIPEKADVMAFSMGSLYAIRACALLQNKVSSLVTVCSSARFPSDPNWPGFNFDFFLKCQKLLNPRRCERVLRLFVKAQAMEHGNGQDLHFLKEQLAHAVVPSFKVLMHGIETAKFVDVREDLKNLKIPVLQLFGSKDKLVTSALNYAFRDNELRRSYIFAQSAHNPYLTEPETFAKVTGSFFDTVHDFLD